MKKHLSLLCALLISACSGPVSSVTSNLSTEPVISSSEESTTSIVESTSTSTTSVISSESTTSSLTTVTSSSSSLINSTSSIPSSSSTTSSTSSSSSISSSSSSTSVPTSTSSSSSSQGGEQQLSSLEAFNKLHDGLKLKNSTFFVEDYIEEKLINDKILANRYFGNFAEYYGDSGYFHYLDQGIYEYEINQEGQIIVGDCKSLNKDTPMSEFFYTTYEFYTLKSKWRSTSTNYLYTSTNKDLGAVIHDLGGNGIYNEVAKSYSNKLEVAPDGLSATFTSTVKTDGFGDCTSVVLVKDLGTTSEPAIEDFLNSATPLVSTNDFPSNVKEGLKSMFGNDIPVPEGISYAHHTDVLTYQGVTSQVVYEDFLIGDQVESYKQALEDYGFVLSSETDPEGDLKEYGFVVWLYDILVDSTPYRVELFFYPKVYLDTFEQGMYPNGIFHAKYSLNTK